MNSSAHDGMQRREFLLAGAGVAATAALVSSVEAAQEQPEALPTRVPGKTGQGIRRSHRSEIP